MRDSTRGLIDLIESVSHNPDEEDWYDVNEYIELLSRPDVVLREIAHWIHGEFL